MKQTRIKNTFDQMDVSLSVQSSNQNNPVKKNLRVQEQNLGSEPNLVEIFDNKKKYKIAEIVIGQSVNCIVKVVQVRQGNQSFALKQINVKDSSELNNIEDSLKKQMNLKHQNIIRVYDIFKDNKMIFALTELAENGNLYQYLRSNHKNLLTEDNFFPIFMHITLALDHLHKNNYVHGSIKPENILINQNLEVKLTGFSAKFKEFIKETQFEYCAPEQLNNQSFQNTKVDIWQLGVVCYEILHGYLPFKSNNDEQSKKNILSSTPNFNEFLSSELIDLIQKILSKDPDQRPTTKQIFQSQWIQKYSQNFDLSFILDESIIEDHSQLMRQKNNYAVQYSDTEKIHSEIHNQSDQNESIQFQKDEQSTPNVIQQSFSENIISQQSDRDTSQNQNSNKIDQYKQNTQQSPDDYEYKSQNERKSFKKSIFEGRSKSPLKLAEFEKERSSVQRISNGQQNQSGQPRLNRFFTSVEEQQAFDQIIYKPEQKDFKEQINDMIVCSNIQTGGELTSEKPLENDERIEFHNVGLFSDLNLETPTNRILSNLKKTNIFQLDQESEIRDVSPQYFKEEFKVLDSLQKEQKNIKITNIFEGQPKQQVITTPKNDLSLISMKSEIMKQMIIETDHLEKIQQYSDQKVKYDEIDQENQQQLADLRSYKRDSFQNSKPYINNQNNLINYHQDFETDPYKPVYTEDGPIMRKSNKEEQKQGGFMIKQFQQDLLDQPNGSSMIKQNNSINEQDQQGQFIRKNIQHDEDIQQQFMRKNQQSQQYNQSEQQIKSKNQEAEVGLSEIDKKKQEFLRQKLERQKQKQQYFSSKSQTSEDKFNFQSWNDEVQSFPEKFQTDKKSNHDSQLYNFNNQLKSTKFLNNDEAFQPKSFLERQKEQNEFSSKQSVSQYIRNSETENFGRQSERQFDTQQDNTYKNYGHEDFNETQQKKKTQELIQNYSQQKKQTQQQQYQQQTQQQQYDEYGLEIHTNSNKNFRKKTIIDVPSNQDLFNGNLDLAFNSKIY